MGYEAADSTNASFETALPPPPEGEYDVELGLTEEFGSPLKPGCRYFKVGLTHLGTGAKHDFVEQVDGHQYPAYAAKSIATIKGFVGAALGYDLQQSNSQVTGKTLQGVAQAKTMLVGRRVRVTVIHKQTKMGKTIAKFIGVTPLMSPVGAAPSAAPPPAPAPAGVPFPPAPWVATPGHPGYFYKPGDSASTSEADLRRALGK